MPRSTPASVAAMLAIAPLLPMAPPSAGPPTAQRLFVATLDGTVHALPLEAGIPSGPAVKIELDDRLRFLALHPERSVVYALGDARLHALAWDSSAGTWTLLGAAEVGVRGTHVEVDPTGRCAIVASYGEHAVTLLSLTDEGLPEEPTVTLGGGDEDTFRNAHQVRVHPMTRAVHVPCLGSDHVATLSLDAAAGQMALVGTAPTPAGAGPRHMDYHPTLPLAFALNELESSVTTFAVDPEDGALTARGTVTTLPAGHGEGASRSSDVHVSPDGAFLFAVNREPLNDIVTFAIERDGGLRALGRVSTGGDHARTFAVDPSGERLWVANTRSRELTTFRIGDDGLLQQEPGTWTADAEIYCVLAR